MEKEKGFRAWGWIGSIVAAVGAILFMLAPVINFETKYYVGEKKVKNYFTVTLGGMFDSSVTRPWIMTVILVLIGLSVLFIALWNPQDQRQERKACVKFRGRICFRLRNCPVLYLRFERDLHLLCGWFDRELQRSFPWLGLGC